MRMRMGMGMGMGMRMRMRMRMSMMMITRVVSWCSSWSGGSRGLVEGLKRQQRETGRGHHLGWIEARSHGSRHTMAVLVHEGRIGTMRLPLVGCCFSVLGFAKAATTRMMGSMIRMGELVLWLVRMVMTCKGMRERKRVTTSMMRMGHLSVHNAALVLSCCCATETSGAASAAMLGQFLFVTCRHICTCRCCFTAFGLSSAHGCETFAHALAHTREGQLKGERRILRRQSQSLHKLIAASNRY